MVQFGGLSRQSGGLGVNLASKSLTTSQICFVSDDWFQM